jgi:hypothetical protein
MLPPPGVIESIMSVPQEVLPPGGMMQLMMNMAQDASRRMPTMMGGHPQMNGVQSHNQGAGFQ